jgi:type VI secretion system protein ImpH
MLAPQRRRPTSVVAQLLADPQRFGFFQAVRLLQGWLARAHTSGKTSGTEPVARAVHFRNSLSLAFPTSEIEELTVVAKEGALDEMLEGSAAAVERIDFTPAFIGLLGPSGTLPRYYTELLAQRETYHRDRAARAFLDLFSDRAVALFYEAWRKHRLHIQYESDRRNGFVPLVLSIAGLGQGALRSRLRDDQGGVFDESIAYFAGAVQQRPVSAGQLQRMLAEYFRVPVQVEQFIGRWFDLPAQHASALGLANCALDASALVGARVWRRELRLRLVLGPMKRARFEDFLPGRKGARALAEFVTLLTGVAFEYEVRLALAPDQVPPLRLAADGEGGRIGWDTWLQTRPGRTPRADAGYELHTVR